MAKKASTSKAATTASRSSATTTRAAPAQPEGEHTDLATPQEADKMKADALKPAARKAAIADGKKDPLAKYGPPDAHPDTDPAATAARRAAFG
jgi:hypothetical protein